MDSDEKKLIEEIKEGLLNFELPYEEGNWENFLETYGDRLNEENKNRKIRIWLWRSIPAAALLAIGISAVLLLWNNKERNSSTPPSNTAHKPTTSATPILPTEKTDISNEKKQKVHSILPSLTTASISDSSMKKPAYRPIRPQLSDIPPKKKAKITLELTSLALNKGRILVFEKAKRTEKVASDRIHMPSASSDKWQLGLELTNSFRLHNPNTVAGILTQFKVSEKIRLSAGLMYSSLTAPHHSDPVQLSYDTKIVGGESSLKAVDLPLSVEYEPYHGWYVSVGISNLTVLKEEKLYHMQTEKLQESVTTDPATGAAITVFEVKKSEFVQQASEKDFEGKSNLRYLNFSLGRKQHLTQHIDLSIEPFVKIPMGNLKKTNIDLLQSGLKFKVIF